MSTTKFRISDDYGDPAEISVKKTTVDGVDALKVGLNFMPKEYHEDIISCMVYTPEQARHLAARLMEAAERADKGVL